MLLSEIPTPEKPQPAPSQGEGDCRAGGSDQQPPN